MLRVVLSLAIFGLRSAELYDSCLQNARNYPNVNLWLEELGILAAVETTLRPFLINNVNQGKNAAGEIYVLLHKGGFSHDTTPESREQDFKVLVNTIENVTPKNPHKYKISCHTSDKNKFVYFVAKGKTKPISYVHLLTSPLTKRIDLYLALSRYSERTLAQGAVFVGFDARNILLEDEDYEQLIITAFDKLHRFGYLFKQFLEYGQKMTYLHLKFVVNNKERSAYEALEHTANKACVINMLEFMKNLEDRVQVSQDIKQATWPLQKVYYEAFKNFISNEKTVYSNKISIEAITEKLATLKDILKIIVQEDRVDLRKFPTAISIFPLIKEGGRRKSFSSRHRSKSVVVPVDERNKDSSVSSGWKSESSLLSLRESNDAILSFPKFGKPSSSSSGGRQMLTTWNPSHRKEKSDNENGFHAKI